MSSFWDDLLPADQQQSFQPFSKPDFSLGSKKAWRICGPLHDRWQYHVLPKIREAADPNNIRAIIAKSNRSVDTTVIWSCYLVGKKPQAKYLTPAIVARTREISVAKAATKYLERLKNGTLQQLLHGFTLTYTVCEVTLCADIDDRRVSSGDLASRSVCGAYVSINNDQRSDGAVHATIGGVVRIGDEHFGLTTTHPFLHLKDYGIASDDPVQPIQNTAAVGDQPSDDHLIDVEDDHQTVAQEASKHHEPYTSLQGWQISINHVSDTEDEHPTIVYPHETPLNEQFSGSKVIYSEEASWALVPIENQSVSTVNFLDLPNDARLYLKSETESPPEGDVLIAAGVSGLYLTRADHNSSIIALPGSGKLHVAWSTQGSSSLGDCGSWVIDDHGRPFGMVVATDVTCGETFCLPLATIKNDIAVTLGNGGDVTFPSQVSAKEQSANVRDLLAITSDQVKASPVGLLDSSEESREPSDTVGASFTHVESSSGDRSYASVILPSTSTSGADAGTQKNKNSNTDAQVESDNTVSLDSGPTRQLPAETITEHHDRVRIVDEPRSLDDDPPEGSKGQNQSDGRYSNRIETSTVREKNRPSKDESTPENPTSSARQSSASTLRAHLACRALDQEFLSWMRSRLRHSGCNVDVVHQLDSAFAAKERLKHMSTLIMTTGTESTPTPSDPQPNTAEPSANGSDSHTVPDSILLSPAYQLFATEQDIRFENRISDIMHAAKLSRRLSDEISEAHFDNESNKLRMIELSVLGTLPETLPNLGGSGGLPRTSRSPSPKPKVVRMDSKDPSQWKPTTKFPDRRSAVGESVPPVKLPNHTITSGQPTYRQRTYPSDIYDSYIREKEAADALALQRIPYGFEPRTEAARSTGDAHRSPSHIRRQRSYERNRVSTYSDPLDSYVGSNAARQDDSTSARDQALEALKAEIKVREAEIRRREEDVWRRERNINAKPVNRADAEHDDYLSQRERDLYRGIEERSRFNNNARMRSQLASMERQMDDLRERLRMNADVDRAELYMDQGRYTDSRRSRSIYPEPPQAPVRVVVPYKDVDEESLVDMRHHR